MNTQKLLAAAVLCCGPLLGQYAYNFTDALTSNQTTKYTEVNSGVLSFTSHGLTTTDSTGGSLIYASTITPNPGNQSLQNNYEVKTTLTLTQNAGVFITYLRATPNALSGPGVQGTFYSVELSNPTFNGTSCTATLLIVRTINGQFTVPVQTTVPCHSGMVIRSVYTQNFGINVYIDNVWYVQWIDPSPITTGQPGVGLRGTWGSNYISSVAFGPLDTIAPNAVTAAALSTSAFATSPSQSEIDMQWQPPSDDTPYGIGVGLYTMVRDGTYVDSFQEPEFTDEASSIVPNSTHNYTIITYDYHFNQANYSFSVTTPGSTDIDFRRVGVKPGGSYWGGGGENIDMRSGNLNFTIPLLKINGRGWSVPFSLSYNSENWRNDNGTDWNLGRDVGFGWGWKLQGGSLTPYWSQVGALDHYIYRDSTGAEYRLNVNTSGVWTSKEAGIYMAYDTTVSPPALYFPDGTFWVFGCTSAGTEQDAGTMYPTLIQDSNGNQITVSYATGLSVTWPNSSGRMGQITDVNNGYYGYYTFTYQFINSGDPIPHLTGISAPYGGSYSFQYGTNSNLDSPFSGRQLGTAQMLQSATNTTASLTTSFLYGSNNAGELTQVKFPYGGLLNWAYGTISYTASRSQREVETRYLTMSTGGTQLTYPISYTGALNVTMHSAGTVTDAGGLGRKQWNFDTTTTDAGFGLQSSYVESNWVSGAFATVAQTNYTWTSDSLSRPYIGTASTTLDGIATKKTTQQLDQFGNVTSMNLYDFGASSPTRTYTNTYLTDSSGGQPSGSNYGAEHINNRLLTSTLTENGQTATLANNSYDSYNASVCTSNGVTYTPSGWQWYNNFTGTGNKTNVFRGNVTTNVGMDMTHTYCYVTTGAVAMSIDGGHITTTQTDGTTNYTLPTAITTGSLTMSATWTSLLAPSSQTGPNGDTTSIAYDTSARPLKTTTPYGAYTTYTYATSSSNPLQNTAIVTSTDPHTNGRNTVTKMDGLGRTIEVDSIDSGGTIRSIVQTQYAPCGCSPLGKISQQSQPYAPGGTEYWTVYTYDGLGRTTKVVAPDGASTTTYSYSGNTVSVTDPAGNLRTFTMDAFGNLTKVVEPDSSQTTTNNQATTSYTYDALNHLVGVSMPRLVSGNTVTQTRSFSYASGSTLGVYLLSATNPENGTVNYTYNADGTMKTKWDAKGQQSGYFLQYLYDSYGRVITIQTVPGTPSSPSTPATVLRSYTYDTNSVNPNYSQYASGRLTTVTYSVPSTSTGYNQYHQLVTFTGDIVTEMYTYTQPGQVAGKELQVARQVQGAQPLIATLSATWNYTQYNEGHLMGVTYPGDPNGIPVAPSYTYTYDGMGRLNTMTDENQNIMVSGTTYNAAGQMTAMGVESRTYNSMGQLINVTYPNTLNITYTYPSNQNIGKISSQHDNISGETVSYVYDTLNRLTSATGSGWNQGYVYDPFGNLGSKTGSDSWYGVPNSYTNQLGSTDANGNMLASPSATGLSYDAENRLTSVNYSYQQYAYDGQNKRIWAVVWNSGHTAYTSETYYFYSPQGKLMAQFNPQYSNGTFSFLNGAARSYFGGRLLGSEDRLGSRGTYYPYGEVRGSTSPTDGNVAFATYTWDQATVLQYADQRYYASTYGRFLSPDPYRATATSPSDPKSPQSWNRYPYVTGDPVNINDRKGLDGQLASQDPGYCDEYSQDPSCEGGLYGAMDPCSPGEEFISGVNPCVNEGSPPPPPPPSPTCEQQLFATISTALAGSPLAGEASDFLADAQQAGLNPLLLVAVSWAESQYGATAPRGTYNAFGLLHRVRGRRGKARYVPDNFAKSGQWNAGIILAAKAIDNQFDKGNVTVSLMYSGQIGAYCVGACSKGETNVENDFRSLGGGDPNNPFNLLWPCP